MGDRRGDQTGERAPHLKQSNLTGDCVVREVRLISRDSVVVSPKGRDDEVLPRS